MRPASLACPLGVTEQTLSAWLDGLLAPDERAQLERHLAECAACQQRLAALQRVSQVLRGQREPQLTAEVWRGLQARIANPATRRSDSVFGRVFGRLPAAAYATVAAGLIIALFVGLFALRANRPSGSGSTIISPTSTSAAPATTTPSAAASATPTSSASAQSTIPPGWTAAAIPDGLIPALAFAPSAPGVGYAVSVLSGGAVTVSATQDGGATWRALAHPTSNQDGCQIAVDPTDASDVALVCTPAASSGFTILRSFDGAKTWTRPTINVTVNCYQNMGFADSTLLMTFMLCDSMSSQTQLFASVDKGPFRRLDTNGKVSGIILSAQIRLLIGHGSTYYIQMGDIEYNPPQLADTMLVSQDAGATWTTTTFSDNGAGVHLLAVDPLDHYWVGAYQNTPLQLLISSDGGRSWRKLPPPWANATGPGSLFVAPDGTVFVSDASVTLTDYPPTTFPLYAATPGATQWTSALQIPDPGAFWRVTGWDSNGHPTTLWAQYATEGGKGVWYLISHPLA